MQNTTSGALAFVCLLVELGIAAAVIAGLWKMFVKAGKPGWAAIVPIYNTIVMLEIVGKPIWWIVFFLIPIANIVVAIIVIVELAKCFGKGAGYAVGMIFLPFIFIPMLGFGSDEYLGPEGSSAPRRKKRRRVEDDDDDDEDDRPRSRRRDEGDDEEGFVEDRPAKRRRKEEDRFQSDEPAPKPRPAPPLAGDAVLIQCTGCQKKLKVPAAVIGKKVKCPACGAAFVAG